MSRNGWIAVVVVVVAILLGYMFWPGAGDEAMPASEAPAAEQPAAEEPAAEEPAAEEPAAEEPAATE